MGMNALKVEPQFWACQAQWDQGYHVCISRVTQHGYGWHKILSYPKWILNKSQCT